MASAHVGTHNALSCYSLACNIFSLDMGSIAWWYPVSERFVVRKMSKRICFTVSPLSMSKLRSGGSHEETRGAFPLASSSQPACGSPLTFSASPASLAPLATPSSLTCPRPTCLLSPTHLPISTGLHFSIHPIAHLHGPASPHLSPLCVAPCRPYAQLRGHTCSHGVCQPRGTCMCDLKYRFDCTERLFLRAASNDPAPSLSHKEPEGVS